MIAQFLYRDGSNYKKWFTVELPDGFRTLEPEDEVDMKEVGVDPHSVWSSFPGGADPENDHTTLEFVGYEEKGSIKDGLHITSKDIGPGQIVVIPPTDDERIIEFISANYPKYTSSQRIAEFNDMCVACDTLQLLIGGYDYDKIKLLTDRMELEILKTAVLCYLDKEK